MLKPSSSESIPLRCTTCGHRGRAVGMTPGRTVNCPVCDERLIVPAPPSVLSSFTVPTPPPPETSGLTAATAATDAVEYPLDCRD